MMGVLCIFDNYEQIIHNVISWLKPKGRLILFNMISEKSLQLVCEKNLAELRTVNPFTIELDIKQKSDDLMRSWTEKG